MLFNDCYSQGRSQYCLSDGITKKNEWTAGTKGNHIPAHRVHLYARFLLTNLAAVIANPVCTEWVADVQQSRAGLPQSRTAAPQSTDCLSGKDADECFCCRAPRLGFFQLYLRKLCNLIWLGLYSSNNVGCFKYVSIQREAFSRNHSKRLGYVNQIASNQPPPHFPAQPPSHFLEASLPPPAIVISVRTPSRLGKAKQKRSMIGIASIIEAVSHDRVSCLCFIQLV